ncbi:hypothetical protein B0H34DRAFT_712558 [Crassisporium funariophilum]|nr:hypothetical protein B0H34DRAFT_712558 [Crassisporium funariophilum]
MAGWHESDRRTSFSNVPDFRARTWGSRLSMPVIVELKSSSVSLHRYNASAHTVISDQSCWRLLPTFQEGIRYGIGPDRPALASGYQKGFLYGTLAFIFHDTIRREKSMPTISTHLTLLPGFGRPVNYIPDENDPEYVGRAFQNALSGNDVSAGYTTLPLTTLRELTMLQWMNVVTDKADWHVKVHDYAIVQKWREEAIASGRDITPKMVDWCIAELVYKAKLVTSPHQPIVVYNGDVVKSDTAVSPDLRKALQTAVTKFEESIADKSKDWHPGSNQKVWDLVHPSLFPLVYGRTRVLANGETTTLEDCIHRCGQGEITKAPRETELIESGPTVGWAENIVKKPYSAKFQWLPSEVDISGEEARITSYINNLHPLTQKPLYDVVSRLITASIPLWDLTLVLLASKAFHRDRRIDYTSCEYNPDPGRGPQAEGPQRREDEDFNDFYYRRQEWIESVRKVVLPEPSLFEPMETPPMFSLRNKYGKRGLQVIVKLANIELTPENPEYSGGSWHVEGQLNEHIVATSLYYYSCNNITPSSLSFKQQCDPEVTDEMGYEQHQHDWLMEVFGCEQDGPGVQEIGSIDTREGRLITFPNILQHRVNPFKLADHTKPGHRKIVALFLVDPNIKVISTAHVPCQRKDWWMEAMLNAHQANLSADLTKRSPGILGLPVEIQDHIFDQVDVMDLNEALSLRLELMEERKQYVVDQGRAFEHHRAFSLCEH